MALAARVRRLPDHARQLVVHIYLSISRTHVVSRRGLTANLLSRQLIPMVRNFRSWVEPSTTNYSYPDNPWPEQETRNLEENHLNALKGKDATMSLKGQIFFRLESEVRDLQANSTGQLEEVK